MTIRRIGVASGAVLVLCARLASAAEDPGVPGPHGYAMAAYGSGNVPTTKMPLPSITVEAHANVYYPGDIATGGPYPLVVVLHGKHNSCENLSDHTSASNWPCVVGQREIPNYEGYDYIGTLLASHGMIVVSISANGINAVDNSRTNFGMDDRAALIQYHLEEWRKFNQPGSSLGNLFVNRVDLTRVGTIGHSRGGEGVVFHNQLVQASGPASPWRVRAVMALAPTDNFRRNVNGVALGVVMAYCDGDQFDLPGVRFFDDSRYSSGDAAPKYTILGLGANHNFFNRMWTPGEVYPGSPGIPVAGTTDDWSFYDSAQNDPNCGLNGVDHVRLTPAKQRGFGGAYISAFFRRHLQDQTQFDAILKKDAPPPPSAQTSAVQTAFQPGEPDRRDINRLTTFAALTTNALGGAVTSSGLLGPMDVPGSPTLCGGFTTVPCVGVVGDRDGHYPSLSRLELGWNSISGSYTNAFFAQDVSNFATLQFRAAVDFSDPKNAQGSPQDLSVRLVDGNGSSSTVPISNYSSVLYYPPSLQVYRGLVMNTVRIPMRAFTGVDITRIASVVLLTNRIPRGSVLISDLAFSDEGMSVAEIITVTG